MAAAWIRGSELAKIYIDLPPLEVQQKIASILSKYDDLIETNTKRIKILEQTAQEIYKEWFVKFKYPGYESVPMVESATDFDWWFREKVGGMTNRR